MLSNKMVHLTCGKYDEIVIKASGSMDELLLSDRAGNERSLMVLEEVVFFRTVLSRDDWKGRGNDSRSAWEWGPTKRLIRSLADQKGLLGMW